MLTLLKSEQSNSKTSEQRCTMPSILAISSGVSHMCLQLDRVPMTEEIEQVLQSAIAIAIQMYCKSKGDPGGLPFEAF